VWGLSTAGTGKAVGRSRFSMKWRIKAQEVQETTTPDLVSFFLSFRHFFPFFVHRSQQIVYQIITGRQI
jgi:hypothetical protein